MDNKNLFIVELVTRLGFEFIKKKSPTWVAKFIFSGPIGYLLSQIVNKYMEMLIQEGILLIDLGLMARRVGLDEEKYKKFIEKTYLKLKKGNLSEDEKEKIRQDYRDTLSDFAIIGVRKS